MSLEAAILEEYATHSNLTDVLGADRVVFGDWQDEQDDRMPYGCLNIEACFNEFYTSDGRTDSSLVRFQVWDENKEIAREIAKQIVDAFDNTDFARQGEQVLKMRKDNIFGLQEEDGVWQYLVQFQVMHRYDPDAVDPGGGGEAAELIFSQTVTVSVHTQSAEMPLTGSGVGTLEIAADTWGEGDQIVLEASGDYSTKSPLAGNAALVARISSDLALSFPLNLLASQTTREWRLKITFTRRTTGAAGTVEASGTLWADGTTPYPLLVTTSATVSSEAAKTLGLFVDWETSDLGNIWRCRELTRRDLQAVAA